MNILTRKFTIRKLHDISIISFHYRMNKLRVTVKHIYRDKGVKKFKEIRSMKAFK